MLLFDVSGQTLKRTDHFNPATDSVEYLKAKFTFNDNAWSGKVKTALFRLGNAVYKSVIDTSGVCKVPAEVLVGGVSRLARLHGETIYISLLGEYSTTRITTNEVGVKLNRSGYGDAETPADPTESEYQQMTAVAADAVAEAEAARAECENARADLVGVKNIFANAIKGNLSGVVVRADDVSPVEQNPVVKVHGKNLSPYGTITFTRNKSYLLDNPLPAGTYTISAHITSDDTDSIYSAVSINNKNEVMKYIALKRGNRVSSTFSVDKPITNIDFCAAYNYSQGEGDTATWSDIQIEQGETATEYTPYIDPSTVAVRRCGKNLLNPNSGSSSGKGLTFTNNGNGSFTVKGTASAAASFGLTRLTANPMYLHKGVTYTQSVIVLSGSMNGVAVVPSVEDGDGNVTWNYFSNNQTKTPEKHYKFRGYEVYVENGKTVDLTFNVQLEVGSVATAFEPYSGAEYTPNADGAVPDITSLSPNMTILTDTEGVIVECEYIRDSNAVIDRIVNAIVNLGGTV